MLFFCKNYFFLRTVTLGGYDEQVQLVLLHSGLSLQFCCLIS